MKVLMRPHLGDFQSKHESGVKRVVEAYFKYLPKYDIELVDKDEESYDLIASHAGGTGSNVDVAHIHGLYWTADYLSQKWQHQANKNIVNAVRAAKQITVPSEWVAQVFRRDMRIDPVVVPHGIDWKKWTHKEPNEGYVLWNKNRNYDVCDPTPMYELSSMFEGLDFVTTFMPPMKEPLPNTVVTGTMRHDLMREVIQRAGVYLSSTKETFCIGVLEAMAAGVPVLGYDYGGNSDLVKHGVTGYLARPNDIDDLAKGLQYCLKYRDTLGANAAVDVQKWSWDEAARLVADSYQKALDIKNEKNDVTVVIPVYNYATVLERAVVSAIRQTKQPREIIIVDDGSTDNTQEVGERLAAEHDTVRYIRKENGGVATARDRGIQEAKTKLVCCLDADDKIREHFLEVCTDAFDDPSLGIAYTKLLAISADGKERVSDWPSDFDFDAQIKLRGKNNDRGMNQVPTCCVFRRDIWERVGGFNQAYAPRGAGAEDAEFWTRYCATGYRAELVTKSPLFVYSIGTGLVSGAKKIHHNVIEPHWLKNKAYSATGKHPFASPATPENGVAHNVMQYDEPIVSVIIPIGPGHETIARRAIDSVEGQTYHRWELILVFDMEEIPDLSYLKGYTHAKILATGGKKGAGAARNMGVDASASSSSFVVFLDADDEIHKEFLEACFDVWGQDEGIVYTDYIHKVSADTESIKSFKEDEIIEFYPSISVAYIRGKGSDYNCERAQRMPDYERKDLYHWCLVTCLIPKVWHYEIGGFDESMETFEDVVYHWSMARTGKCYIRLTERLVMYNRETSTRRVLADFSTDDGIKVAKKMLQYSQEKLKGVKMAGCTKCPGARARSAQTVVRDFSNPQRVTSAAIEDSQTVLVKYMWGNIGNHRVTGAATGANYGYRRGGDVFLILREDQAAQPHIFSPVQKSVNEPKVNIQTQETKAPVPLISEVFKPDAVPGITSTIAKEMAANGIETKEDIIALGVEGLKEYKGVGDSRAEMILEAVQGM